MQHLARASILTALILFGCTSDNDAPPPFEGGLALSDVGSFTAPVLVTSPPGDLTRIFVVEQGGTIRIVKSGATLPTPFLDIGTKISKGGERGLLGLAFHPGYATNGLFVVNYTNLDGDTRVAVYRVQTGNADLADPASEQIILAVAQPFSNHNGGMVAFGPQDGQLYIGMGDGGSSGDPQGNGQKRTTLLGKLLRLTVSATGQVSVPTDNPFSGQSATRPEIWSLGLRNPWRFSFDRLTSDLYVADVGQGEREEINMVTLAESKAANFGWNITEGKDCYNASSCDRTGLTDPVLDYGHDGGACSVTGGYVYRGADIPTLAGTYFYADYCAGWVRSFRRSNGANLEAREWTSLDPDGRITGFGEDGRGELYLMTGGGRVAKIIAQP